MLKQSVAAVRDQLRLDAFVDDRRGAAMAIVAIVAPAMFGFAALAVDVSMWRAEKLRLQSAVDAAALAGAYAQLDGSDLETTRSAVARELARNGYDPAQPGNGFALDLRQRDEQQQYSDVHVTADTDGALFFAKLLMPEGPIIEATAVGGIDSGSYGRICVLGLEEQATSTVQFRGTPDVDLNCTIVSNSRDANTSMEIAGNATLEAPALIASGFIDIKGNPGITVDAMLEFAPPATDPFGPYGRDLQAPPSGGCDHNGQFRVKNDTVLTPGRYCGGIRVTGATASFTPGLYIIHNGDLRTTGQARLIGDGVTFVLTGSSANQIGNMDFSGGTHLDLRAPDAETAWAKDLGYEGILFFQDPTAPASLSSNGDNKLLGGSIARLEGAVYFPSQTLMYTGGANLDDSCLMLVARQVLFRGNARFVQTDNACDHLGVEELRLPSVQLLG
jgi:Flp pilus assembly protein TadG